MSEGKRSLLLDQLVEIAKEYQANLPQLVGTRGLVEGQRQLTHMNRRAEAQVDAKLKECSPEYKAPQPPEEGMAGNFYNGVFLSDQALEALNQESNSPVIVRPGNGRWWKALLATLLGALLVLGALALYRYLYPPGEPGVSTIVALPFEPPLSERP